MHRLPDPPHDHLTVHVNLEVGGGTEGPAPTGPEAALLTAAVRATLVAEGVPAGEVSVTLVDDLGIRDLNRRYLRRDYVTDVLSFALHGESEPVLADIYIGVQQAERQAAEHGVSEREELVRLAIHGTLHALGYDHPDEDRAASPLFRRQEALVRSVLAGGEDTRQDPHGVR